MEDGLAALQGQYDDAQTKKADLEASVENTNKKLERATTVMHMSQTQRPLSGSMSEFDSTIQISNGSESILNGSQPKYTNPQK